MSSHNGDTTATRDISRVRRRRLSASPHCVTAVRHRRHHNTSNAHINVVVIKEYTCLTRVVGLSTAGSGDYREIRLFKSHDSDLHNSATRGLLLKNAKSTMYKKAQRGTSMFI